MPRTTGSPCHPAPSPFHRWEKLRAEQGRPPRAANSLCHPVPSPFHSWGKLRQEAEETTQDSRQPTLAILPRALGGITGPISLPRDSRGTERG